MAGQRAILVDRLGFGFSDRPEPFGYTIEDHADSVAVCLYYPYGRAGLCSTTGATPAAAVRKGGVTVIDLRRDGAAVATGCRGGAPDGAVGDC